MTESTAKGKDRPAPVLDDAGEPQTAFLVYEDAEAQAGALGGRVECVGVVYVVVVDDPS